MTDQRAVSGITSSSRPSKLPTFITFSLLTLFVLHKAVHIAKEEFTLQSEIDQLKQRGQENYYDIKRHQISLHRYTSILKSLLYDARRISTTMESTPQQEKSMTV